MRMTLAGCSLAFLLTTIATGAQLTEPVAYWNFENDLNNLVTEGTAGNATVVNGAPLIDSTGIVGNSLKFDDSSGDAINVPYGTYPLGDNFTISAWYWQSGLGSGDGIVFESENNFDISYGYSAEESAFKSYIGEASVGTSITSTGQWHHVLHSFQNEGNYTTLNVYIDGQNTLTGTRRTSAIDFPGINFGAKRNENGKFWDGYIDEIALWDSALTTTEASVVYNRGLSGQELEYQVKLPAQPESNIDLQTPEGASVAFDAPGWSPVSYTEVIGGDNDLGDGGFSGETYLRTCDSGDNTMTITLDNMPVNGAISLGMIVAQIDSLDPARDADCFRVRVNGQEILEVGFGHGPSLNSEFNQPVVDDGQFTGEDNETTSPVMINGVEADAELVLDTMTLGFTDRVNVSESPTYYEHMYDLGKLDAFNYIPYSGDSVTIEIDGQQDQATGEFYGIDNITVNLVTPDINADGIVDDSDLQKVLSSMGATGVLNNSADVNLDGNIDGLDLAIVIKSFGTANGAASTQVPEPASITLILLGSIGLLAIRRRK